MNKNDFPLKLVVSVEKKWWYIYDDPNFTMLGYSGWGRCDWYETLECGHVLQSAHKQKPAKKRRCYQCYEVEKNKFIDKMNKMYYNNVVE